MSETVDINMYLNESFYYQKTSPVNCEFLNMISLYLLILLIVSFNLNAILLYIFWNCKPLHKSNNFYMIAITVYNLIGSVFELPIVIQSCLMCKYKFSFLLHHIFILLRYLTLNNNVSQKDLRALTKMKSNKKRCSGLEMGFFCSEINIARY